MSWLESMIGYISPKWAFERQAYRNAIQAASTQYVGAARSQARKDWNFGAGTANAPASELRDLKNRSRDANRNDPLSASLTGTMSMNIAGTGLQPQSKLRADRLGITEEKAEEYRRQIEDIFDLWKPHADAAGLLDFDELQFMAVKKTVEDGETIALPIWRESLWIPFGRTIQMVNSDRLAFPAGKGKKLPNGETNDTGIEVDSFGRPSTYWLRKANSINDFLPIASRDPEGRPNVIHLFRATEPGQLRGVPLVAPILTLLKDFNGIMEATVMRARIAACLAVIFTRKNPMSAMIGNAAGTTADKKEPRNRLQELYPGLIEYVNEGEEAKMLDPAPDGSSFDPFTTLVIRLCCACIGLPYELVIKDFSRTNYSSARAAILEGRRVFTSWRNWLAKKLCQPCFELVIEEAVLRGLLNLPNFYEFKAEYCRSIWIGGGWGWVDPVKEIEAANMAIESGLSTLADECAANGKDSEENLAQRKRERASEQEAGIVRGGSSVPTWPEENQPPTQQMTRRNLILSAALSEKTS